jgi:small-conductance mechanosensitive channel
VLQQFGVLGNAWAALTAILAMVAIGFVAVWSVLSNSLCSILLMVTRPFNVGDTVEIPDVNLRGKVIDFNLIFTTLREEDGSLIQVPNNTFLQKPIRCRVGEGKVTLDEQADREQPTE